MSLILQDKIEKKIEELYEKHGQSFPDGDAKYINENIINEFCDELLEWYNEQLIEEIEKIPFYTLKHPNNWNMEGRSVCLIDRDELIEKLKDQSLSDSK